MARSIRVWGFLGKAMAFSVLAGSLALVPSAISAPKAQAAISPMTPCVFGPVGSRLEVDCTNNDPGPSSVEASGWCTNLFSFDDNNRVGGRMRQHFTRECGPGAHPILWWVNTQTDWELMQSIQHM